MAAACAEPRVVTCRDNETAVEHVLQILGHLEAQQGERRRETRLHASDGMSPVDHSPIKQRGAVGQVGHSRYRYGLALRVT